MEKVRLENKLHELVKEFGQMAEPHCIKLAATAEKGSGSKELKKGVSSLDESLDYLRICIKYHLFDLEATRRENTYLRKLLEDKDD